MRPPYPANLPDRNSHAYPEWENFISLLNLLVGGRSEAARARAGRVADMWQTTTVPLAEFPKAIATIRAQPRGGEVEVGSVLAFNEEADAAREAIRAWEAAGAQHLSINFGPADGRIERMREFARRFGVGR
jgi:hypothetical protein